MTGARRHITPILVGGIVIGIVLGFVVSGGALGRLLPRSRESVLTGKSRTRPELRPDPRSPRPRLGGNSNESARLKRAVLCLILP